MKHNPFISSTAQPATDDSSSQHTPAELLKAVKEKCSKQLTIKRLFYGEIPIEKHYVNLSVVGQDKFQSKVRDLGRKSNQKIREDLCDSYNEIYGIGGSNISIETIITTPKKDEELVSNRILITGTAGIGKSTFSEYLLYLWATERAPYKNYQWVFRIPLRNLRAEYYPIKKEDDNYSPIDIIERTCLAPMLNEDSEPFFQKNERIKFTAELSRLVEEDKVLIILDGYDEIDAQLPENLFKALKSLCAMSQVIITSRPYNLDSLRDIYKFREEPNKHFEITGFTPENIKDYVSKFFTNLTQSKPEETQPLLDFIEHNPNIAGTCRIPINLELICSAWTNQLISRDGYTMSGLYNQIILDLCIRHKEKITEEKIKDQDSSDLLKEYSKHLGLLEYFAYQSIIQDKLFLKITKAKEYVKEIYPNSTENFITQQKEFGLIKPNTLFGENRGSEEYYFNHLTFRDYFAARYLACCLQNETCQMFNRKLKTIFYFPHKWENETVSSASDFICQKKIDTSFEITIWFIAGILAESKDIITLKYFFHLLIKKPYDLSNSYTINLLIRTLDESQNLHKKLPYGLFKLLAKWVYMMFNPDRHVFLNSSNKFTNSQINPSWERLKISQFVFRHSQIEKVFINGLNSNEIVFENTCKTLTAIRQPLANSLLSYILEKEPFNETKLKKIGALFKEKLIEQEKLVDIFKSSQSPIKKRTNAIQLLVEIDYFDLDKVPELIILISNNQEAIELRIAIISALCRAWNNILTKTDTSNRLNFTLKNQNFDNTFKLLLSLIQNTEVRFELQIAAISNLSSILSSNLSSDFLKPFLENKNIDNALKLLLFLIQNTQTSLTLRITALNTLKNIFISALNSYLSQESDLDSGLGYVDHLHNNTFLKSFLENGNIDNAFKILFSLTENSQVPLRIRTDVTNVLGSILECIFRHSYNETVLENENINDIFKTLFYLIQNTKTPLGLCISAINALSNTFWWIILKNQNFDNTFKLLLSLIQNPKTLPKICITTINALSRALSEAFNRIVNREWLKEILENENFNNAFKLLLDLTQNTQTSLELRITTTNALSKSFLSSTSDLSADLLTTLLEHPNFDNISKLLVSIIQDTKTFPELHISMINSIGENILNEFYNFESCEKFIINYFLILTKSTHYNIYHLITLNIPNAQKPISELIGKLKLTLKTTELDFNIEATSAINPTALKILLHNITNSELLEIAIKLSNEKAHIRRALFAVLLIRCIENGKALFFSEEGLNFYEGQTYQTIELTPEQQFIFAHDFEIAFKNLTNLPILYHETDLLKQLDITQTKTLDSNNLGERKMGNRSEIKTRLSITNDSWLLILGRKATVGNIEHAFLIVEGLRNNQRHLWYFDLVLDPDNSGKAMIQQEEHMRQLDSKERLLTKVTCNEFRKGTEIACKFWNISPDQAESLFRDIEHDYQLKGENRITYQILGDRSSSAKASSKNGHSCFTWAREKIRNIGDKDVHIPEHWSDCFATIPSFHLYESEENHYSWWKNPKVMVPIAAVAVPVAAYGVYQCNIM